MQVMERDESGTQKLIFPASGSPVVPLAQVTNDEKTLIGQPRAHFAPAYAAPVYALPEEALSFTVDEAAIFSMFKDALQPRGLLRLRDSFTVGNLLQDTYRRIEQDHIELLFALKADFGAQKKWELDLLDEPKCRIPFDSIECVTFKRWLLKPRLVIRLKPEKRARFFEVDTVIREVVLYVSHKDARLAERLQSAMMTEVSNANLQRLLKG
jgi:hypothetical protein